VLVALEVALSWPAGPAAAANVVRRGQRQRRGRIGAGAIGELTPAELLVLAVRGVEAEGDDGGEEEEPGAG